MTFRTSTRDTLEACFCILFIPPRPLPHPGYGRYAEGGGEEHGGHDGRACVPRVEEDPHRRLRRHVQAAQTEGRDGASSFFDFRFLSHERVALFFFVTYCCVYFFSQLLLYPEGLFQHSLKRAVSGP